MSKQRIENSAVWKRTLASRGNDDKDSGEREELRATFWKFRENAAAITSRIAADFPDLTLHDVNHLDALWETADLLIGEEFLINPLEAFVLGGAIFLHDAALTFEAYEGGKSAVRETPEWKDAFTALQAKQPEMSKEELEKSADFDAIRYLHAAQAEQLVEHSWEASGHSPIFLLEDRELRTHLGRLMGQIAASHHWDIDKVASTFDQQINAPSRFSREWAIQPLKIACILRCADATNFDNARAPDVLYALLKRNHVSEAHWKAQNRISPAAYDRKDPTTLLFTSTIDFPEEDANAWYVAYDALCLAHKEIQASNACLEQSGFSTFWAKRIKGVESPETMAKYIKPKGWKPTAAKMHISNIEDVIRKLGGEQLYGTDADKLEIVLRELIQNARDAVVARRHIEKDFEGKITVGVSKDDKEPDTFWLTVEDNGVGMSERVLTDTLLDFGTSFWTSSLIQSEFRGLRSSGFKSIGQFGIGFFSVFMIAEQVFIESRNWKKGLEDINQVKFTNGLSLKPITCKGEPPKFNSSLSTKIKLKLKQNVLSENLMVEIKIAYMGAKNIFVPLGKYIAAICAGLDVAIFFREHDKPEQKIHESLSSPDFDKSRWLHDISFADYHDKSELLQNYIDQHIHRLKPIIEDECILGLAAIPSIQTRNYFCEFLGLSTVGGLAYGIHSINRHTSHFMGYLDYKPRSAKREINSNTTASQESVNKWAREQLEELLTLNLDASSRYFAASSLSNFNIDPTMLASIFYTQNGVMFHGTVSEIADLSIETGIAFCFSEFIPNIVSEPTEIKLPTMHEYPCVQPFSSGQFISLERTEEGIPENNFSMLDCIYRMARSKGYVVVFDTIHNIGRDRFGGNSNALILKSTRRK